jgi:hypothetical protein
MFADGRLWGALGTAVELESGTQAGITYFVMKPHVTRHRVFATHVSQGYLGLPNNHLTFPAIGVTDDGRAAIAFSVLGPDYYPSAGYVTLDKDHRAGEIHIVAEGLGPHDGFTSYFAFNPNRLGTRWGDYGAASVDGDHIWIASEYIGQTCTFEQFKVLPLGNCGETRITTGNWYTRISKLKMK